MAYADIKAAFGSRFDEKQRWKIVRDLYCHLGQTGMEVIRFPFLDRRFLEQKIKFHHMERFEEVVRADRGVVLLTGHFGNWELLQIISGLLGKPIHALASDQKHAGLNEMLNHVRESHGSTAIRRGIGIRALYRALKDKEPVGMVGDQDAGKMGGMILPLLGRKTTVPLGAFELARRAGVPILPCFIVRRENFQHEVFFGQAISCGEGARGKQDAQELEPYVRQYLKVLEEMISQHPEQWLWGTKRWKYSWTKRILILSDGKPGHFKQSLAVAQQMQSLKTQYGREGMEYPLRTIYVEFKSKWHRVFFAWTALILMPWMQGRLRWLTPFLKEPTAKEIRDASADFIISAGAGLTALNLCLARESRAKSIILMKPGFPFNLFRYDLALIPAHDRGNMPKETIRTLLTPNLVDPENLDRAKEKIRSTLRNPERVKLAVFLGGDTRGYKMDLAEIEKMTAALERLAFRVGDYVITTSRRTPQTICQFLKSKRNVLGGCQMLVIATEDKRPEVVGGMLASAEILIVSEDSISMISEAIATGKKVVVLTLKTNRLPEKHQRFQAILAEREAILRARPDQLEEKIIALGEGAAPLNVVEEENMILQKRLQAIL